MNGNHIQLQGPGGRVQTLTVGTGVQTYFFNLSSLPGRIGNDWIYATKIRFRLVGIIHRSANVPEADAATPMPNGQQLANMVRQVRVYSPILGELYPKAMTYGTFLENHDNWFMNRTQPDRIDQIRAATSLAASEVQVFVDMEVNFANDSLVRSMDTAPWIAFLEGGQIEIDLAPTTAISDSIDGTAWVASGAWTCVATLEYAHDSQQTIHVPAQWRLYEKTLASPAFELANVGSPQGLDGIVSGCRLGVMSWLGAGASNGEGPDYDPFAFYTNSPAGAGVNFAESGLNRIDLPWRDQRSIDDVQAVIHAFIRDMKRRPHRQQIDAASALATIGADISGFPFFQDIDPGMAAGDPLLNPVLGFFPIVWPGIDAKIADMQMIDGTLQYSANFTTPPSSRPHRWRTYEMCQFTQAKVRDLMIRWGTPHTADGGKFEVVPKYEGSRQAGATTAAFLPLKIVEAGK